MIPVGYMYKRIVKATAWLENERVVDIFSVSHCISGSFADSAIVDLRDKNGYIQFWKHNGFWLFNSPLDMESIARENSIDLSETTLFFYEVYEKQFDEALEQWVPLEPDTSFPTLITIPAAKVLQGFDVVSYSLQNMAECSPLSCNGLAKTLPVNAHCLLETLDEAIQSLESGKFDNSEPGPFRIFAVYTVESTYTD